jgi:hypothetical protein
VSKFQDETFEKWVRWVERIEREVLMLGVRRTIWRGTVEMVEANRIDDRMFLTVLTGLYVDAQAMSVRRQADAGDDVVSMRRLLGQIMEHPSVITRERLAERAWARMEPQGFSRAEAEALALSNFDEWTANGKTIDPAIVRAHIDELEDDARKVVDYANRVIAHLDRRGWTEGLTFAELHQTITAIGELQAAYYLLLTGKGKGVGRIAPAIQGDWRAPFRQNLTDALDDEDDARFDY